MTPKQEAALRQALEALEVATTPLAKDRQEVLRAQAAIREALAEQPAQQEPVAWMDGYRNIYSLEEKAAGCPEATIALVPLANQEKTSGSPKPAKPEALRLAELFEVAANAAPEGDEGWLKTAAELRRMHDLLGKANALCRIRAEEIERLKAQPAQEPVAWMWRCKPYCGWPEWSVSLKRPADSGRDGHKRTEGYEDVPLYTSPPASKPWVGLTEEERLALAMHENFGSVTDYAEAIEAKLREKNA